MNARVILFKRNIKHFSFLRNLWGKAEENPDKISTQDKDSDKTNKQTYNKQMPIKEDKINEYFRCKVKKYDGRLN